MGGGIELVTAARVATAPESSGHDQGVPLPRSRFTGLTVALLAVEAVALVAVSSRSYFFADDLLFFQVSNESHLTLDLLRRSAFGHFIPLFYVSNFAFFKQFGLEYRAAVALMVATWLVATLGVRKILRLLGCSELATLALTAVFGLSAVAFHAVMWWAAALCLFTSTALSVWTFAFALEWDRDRRTRYLVAATVSFLAACMFWEKSLLVPGYLGLFFLIVRDSPATFGDRIGKLWDRWPLWVCLGAVAVPYFAAYQAGGYALEAGTPATLPDLASFFRLTWFEAFWPSLAGFSNHFRLFGSTPATVVIGQAVAVGAFVLSARRGTLRGWAFFVIGFAVNMAVLGRARVSGFGPTIGLDLRYHFDNLLLFVLAAGAHLASAQPAPAGKQRPAVRHRPFVVPATVLAVLASTVVAFSAGMAEVRTGPGAFVRRFFDHYRTSAEANAAGGELVVLDQVAPFPISLAGFYPYSLYSRTLVLADQPVRFADAGADQFLIVDSEGTVRAGSFVATTEMSPGECVDDSGGEIELTPPAALPSDSWILRLTYETTNGTAVGFSIGDGAGNRNEARLGQANALDPGSGVLVTALSPAAVRSVVVRSSAALCITGAALGDVAATSP